MAKKIYLLTDGPEDERYISGTYSSRASAEAASRFLGDEGRIEEFEIDAPLPEGPAGASLWCVSEDNEYMVFRTNAFHFDETLEQVEFNDDEGVVYVWASDAALALAKGGALIEQARAQRAGTVRKR